MSAVLIRLSDRRVIPLSEPEGFGVIVDLDGTIVTFAKESDARAWAAWLEGVRIDPSLPEPEGEPLEAPHCGNNPF